jgi:N-methylhydantoinase A
LGIGAGQRINGPAIVESAMTTMLLRPGDTAIVMPHGWLDIAIPAGAGA